MSPFFLHNCPYAPPRIQVVNLSVLPAQAIGKYTDGGVIVSTWVATKTSLPCFCALRKSKYPRAVTPCQVQQGITLRDNVMDNGAVKWYWNNFPKHNERYQD